MSLLEVFLVGGEVFRVGMKAARIKIAIDWVTTAISTLLRLNFFFVYYLISSLSIVFGMPTVLLWSLNGKQVSFKLASISKVDGMTIVSRNRYPTLFYFVVYA